jgi:hypothetical protein
MLYSAQNANSLTGRAQIEDLTKERATKEEREKKRLASAMANRCALLTIFHLRTQIRVF